MAGRSIDRVRRVELAASKSKVRTVRTSSDDQGVIDECYFRRQMSLDYRLHPFDFELDGVVGFAGM